MVVMQGNLDTAIKHLQQAVRGDPDNGDVVGFLKKVKLMDAKKKEGEGVSPPARQAATRRCSQWAGDRPPPRCCRDRQGVWMILWLVPRVPCQARMKDSRVPLYWPGDEAFKGGRYEEAIKAYTACLSVDPSHGSFNAKLYNNRATAYSKLRRHQEVS